jgi:outer membrane protein assembly factor BamB
MAIMKLAPRRALACLPVLAVFLLASCQAPAPAKQAPAGYALDPANSILNLERENMKVAWRQAFGQTSSSKLMDIYCAGKFLVAEGGGSEIIVFDATDYGTYKAGTVLEGAIQVPPAAKGNDLLLATRDRIFTLDTATDTLSDKALGVGMALSTTPLVSGDDLILTSSAGDVASASLKTGKTNWHASIGGIIYDQPVIAGKAVYVAAQRGPAVALTVTDGRPLFRITPLPPAHFSSGIAVSGKTCYVGDDLGTLYGIDSDLGAPRWTWPLNSPVAGVPQVLGDKVLVFSAAPKVTCLQAEAGPKVLWNVDGAKKMLCSSKTMAYFLMADNSVAGVKLADGTVAWRDALPAGTMVVGSSERPEFYIANAEGAIVAISELQ